jgi:autoinducer 2-degrading protein
VYVLTVEIQVDPNHRDEFLSVIRRQAATSVEREDGCLRFDVAVAEDDPNRVLLYEVYRSEAAFDDHVAQPHSKESGARTKPWMQEVIIRRWHAADE